MTFTIPISPKAQKRDRIATRGGHAISYKDSGQKREEDKILALIYQFKPPVPFTGPLSLRIEAYLPIPASKPKRWRQEAEHGIIRPTTKPDSTNLAKQIEDVMNRVFYADDKQIVDLTVRKWYGLNPQWVITLEEIK